MDNIRFDRIRRELKYEGNRLKFYEDTYEMPDGNKAYYDYIENRDGAAVLPVDSDGKLLFVKQYRPALDGESIELPAGSLEYEDEDFMSCAAREAEEETGMIPGKLIYVSDVYPLTAFVKEKTKVYIGLDLKKGEIHRDETEFINVVKLTLDEALNMIETGKITDSKTIIAIFAYNNLILSKKL